MREAGAADARGGRTHESLAVHMLASIRDKQNKPEEARELRASLGVRGLAQTGRAATVGEVTGPAQRAIVQGRIDAAVAAVDEALALAAERIRTNPHEVWALMVLADELMSRQEEGVAYRITVETLRMLEQGPDHPRVADAMGSVISVLAQLGMTATAERAIERQERILIAAKGAEALALNSVSYGRIAVVQYYSNWGGY